MGNQVPQGAAWRPEGSSHLWLAPAFSQRVLLGNRHLGGARRTRTTTDRAANPPHLRPQIGRSQFASDGHRSHRVAPAEPVDRKVGGQLDDDLKRDLDVGGASSPVGVRRQRLGPG